jgi:hypothetical protein
MMVIKTAKQDNIKNEEHIFKKKKNEEHNTSTKMISSNEKKFSNKEDTAKISKLVGRTYHIIHP